MKNFRHPQRPRKSSLVIGGPAVISALKEGKALDKIYLELKKNDAEAGEIRKLATHNGVPVNYVPEAKLLGFNAGEHKGCIALISKVQYQDLQDVISMVVESAEAPLFLILDGITDIRNIGGIARTAYCCGVHAIIIPQKGVGALNEEAILTSAGALEKIAVCRVASLVKAVDDLHLNGIQVVAMMMEAESSIKQIELTLPTAIIMGSEEKGISPILLKVADKKAKIPMRGGFESLNVSVATGIALYEAMNSRM